MSRKRKPGQRLSIVLPPGSYDELMALSEEFNIPKGAVICMAIAKWYRADIQEVRSRTPQRKHREVRPRKKRKANGKDDGDDNARVHS